MKKGRLKKTPQYRNLQTIKTDNHLWITPTTGE
jgi:hypothetical protein